MDGDVTSFRHAKAPSEGLMRWRIPALAAWAVGLTLALGALGIWIVRGAIADQLSANHPTSALALDPHNAPALLSAAEADMRARPPRLDAAEARLRQAAVAVPTDARVFADLGLIAVMRGQSERADALLALAAQRSKRELAPDLWRLDHALKARDYAGAWSAVDILLRTQPGDVSGALAERLAPLAGAPAAQPALLRRLAQNPPWRGLLLTAIARADEGAPVAAALLTGLQKTAHPPTDDEAAVLVQALIGDNQIQQAYARWLQFLPPARLPLLGDVYNGRFRTDGGTAAFNWTVNGDANGLVGLGGGDAGSGLRVVPGDQASGTPLVRELLALPPGRFRLTGQMRAPGASEARDEGFSWTISCADTGQVLGRSDHLSAGDGWTPIQIAFETPAQDCGGQWLSLQRRASLADPTDLPPMLFDQFRIAPVRDDGA
jgi:hypothetical protein